jgi:eukaryotic-like serine/threonine-protein kinase
MVGTRLQHYRILRKLGSGGMGEVYAAEDEKLQRQVALKLLPPDMAADPERLQRFQREARAVAALNHPNVVTIYSVEEADGVHFLTMELVEGSTLDEVIPQGGLPLERILALAGPLIEAVAFAHEHGIIHRDLKPANIMLTGDGRLKVLDFGLAKLKANLAAGDDTQLPTQTLTRHHVVLGTAAYMSPEQAEGRPVDHRSDIFSLGVVLYEMACGRRPFTGDSDLSLISSIIKDTPRPLADVRRDLPPALDRIVMRALAKDPAHRYQRAGDLRADLAAVQEQSVTGRLLAGVLRAIARSRWTRRAALAAVVLAVGSAGAWYLSARRGASVQGPAAPPLRFRTTRLSAHPGVEQFPSLLPDGKWVLYAGQETGNFDIYLLSTSGQNPINLTADSPADDDEPAASPDGERIAFRSSREGGGVFVMGRTGEGVRRVTPTGVSVAFNPAWSPDGAEIAYTTENVQLTPMNGEGASGLWIVNVNTGQQRKLDVGDAMQAVWSPHKQRIAFVSRPLLGGSGVASGEGFTKIRTVPVGGGPAQFVTSGKATDWSPVWAPDGKYLYFVSDRGGSMNLWRVAIDEASGKPLGEPEPIITPAPFLAHPSVSADGRRIAYTAVSQTSNIQRLPLDPAAVSVKGAPSWVTTGSRLWANPDPTPDGDWVVFYSRDQPEGNVYICRPDGTGLRQLTSDAIDRVPRWSPDGKWVAFFSERGGKFQIWKIRAADGSDLQQMTDTGSVAVWSPDSKRLATSAPSPNGERSTFVFDANRTAAEQKPEVLPVPNPDLRLFIPISWSPDGARLAGQIGFSDRGGAGIALYSFASRTYERLTDFGEWPAWFGDSRRILFVFKGREFWVLDTRTKQTKKIYSTVWDVLGPPRITRDARAVYFSRRVTEGDIYLLSFE